MEMREPSAKYLTSQLKRTEAGDIPIDWIEKPIGEMAEVTSGGTPSRKMAAFWGGDIPWVTTAELEGGQVTEASQHITAAGLQNSAAKWLPAGTLLIALYGQGKTRGKCAVLGIAATTNQACAGIKLKGGVDGDFVRHNLAHRYEYIRSLSNGGSQENLSGEIVKKIRIGMPSTRAEQRAIADALTDTDALIDSLEQLLTKKRQIKQGAMQELLTGKRRLPEFSADWKLLRLGQILRFQAGFPFPSHGFCSQERGLRLIRNRDLKSNSDVVHFDGTFESQYVVSRGDVLVGMDGDFMPCMWAGEDALLNQRVGRVRPLSGLAPTFAYYFLIDKLKAIEDATGSTTVKHLSHRDVEDIEAEVPELAEQLEIGEALHDIDKNLSVLESRLTKARALKQAMAQALLTGRIRLLEPTACPSPPKATTA